MMSAVDCKFEASDGGSWTAGEVASTARNLAGAWRLRFGRPAAGASVRFLACFAGGMMKTRTKCMEQQTRFGINIWHMNHSQNVNNITKQNAEDSCQIRVDVVGKSK